MRGQPRLTLVALAWREGEELELCFRSLSGLTERTGASTLIVLDDDADQATRQIAHRIADRVVEFPFTSFSRQRNLALQAAGTEWVFFIDADERCTLPLALEIEGSLRSPAHDAYRVPRRNILFGREIKHTGWWPDYQVRLLRRECCRYDELRRVHERPIVHGSIGTCSSPLIHFNYKSWSQFAGKQRAYAQLEAQALLAAGRRQRPRSFVGQPLREFKRRYFEYRGYKDGALGLILSLAMAAYSLEVQRQLFLLRRKNRK